MDYQFFNSIVLFFAAVTLFAVWAEYRFWRKAARHFEESYRYSREFHSEFVKKFLNFSEEDK